MPRNFKGALGVIAVVAGLSLPTSVASAEDKGCFRCDEWWFEGVKVHDDTIFITNYKPGAAGKHSNVVDGACWEEHLDYRLPAGD